jgi:hypothetical protein
MFALACGASFYLAVSSDGRLSSAASAANAQRIPHETVTPLRMRALREGNTILISWDPQSVSTASSAFLDVYEGADVKRVPLNTDQLSSGLMAYSAPSGDLLLRLEFRNGDKAVASQSVALLSSAAAPAHHDAEITASKALMAALTRAAREPNTRQKSHPENRVSADVVASRAIARREREAPVSESTKTVITAPNVGDKKSASINTPAIDRPPALNTSVTSAAPQFEAAISAFVPKPSPPAPISGSIAKPNTPSASVMSVDYVPPTPLKWTEPSAKDLKNGSQTAFDIALKIHIDESGHVTKVRALNEGQKPPKELMKLADRTVKTWLFQPARYQGKAIGSEDTIVLHVRK